MFDKILIFSGTTEGRQLSAYLAKEKIHHYVSVATEYGQNVMEESEYVKVHVGRMEFENIIDYLTANEFSANSLIVDASHPYAQVISKNLIRILSAASFTLMRISRGSMEMDAYEYSKTENCFYYNDIEEVANEINRLEGNILVTTGSKEIGKLASNISDKNRLFVRVLPSVESLELCAKAEIPEKQIIAMHGPFSAEMNDAIIKQYNIKHLLTKESGSNGGFKEKLVAADENNCKCHIIRRPKEISEDINDSRINVVHSAIEAFNIITGHKLNNELNVKLIGVGMGNANMLTPKAKEAIELADAVFGAKRLIKDINKSCYDMYQAKDIIPILEENEDIKNAVILFSGDTGFYSGAKLMKSALDNWENRKVYTEILPGISSISYLAAKIGESYEDAYIYSLHGRGNLYELVEKCKYNKKVFCLLSDYGNINDIAKIFCDEHIECNFLIGRNLSYDDEEIIRLDANAAKNYCGEGIVSIFIENPKAINEPVINMKTDEDFIRDKVPMTKSTIRHESIIKLNLKKNDVVYDIGAGTGSVAIEIAGLDNSLSVYAIEKKEEACSLITKNIEKHKAYNANLYEGAAVEILSRFIEDGIPLPDAVFIGGSGGELNNIIKILNDMRLRKQSSINVVINAISLETINEVNQLIKTYENEILKNVKISQIQVSNVNEIGEYHLLKAENPVMIFSFEL